MGNLRESFNLGGDGYSFSRDAGTNIVTLTGVAILQPESRNMRVYTEAAMEQATPLYEGVSVFLGHGNKDDLKEQVAFLSNSRLVRVRGKARVIGDLVLNSGHPRAEQLAFIAEHNPKAAALSHEIPEDGFEATMQGDIQYIESIDAVDGVALVTQGGVNGGLDETFKETSMSKEADAIRVAADEAVKKLTEAAEAVKGRKSYEAIDGVREELVKLITDKLEEACGCLQSKAEESDKDKEIAALQKQLEEMKAKLDEADEKLAAFEAEKVKSDKQKSIESKAEELGVVVTEELLEHLIDLPEEKIEFFLKNSPKADVTESKRRSGSDSFNESVPVLRSRLTRKVAL